jgi:hypothetical protein
MEKEAITSYFKAISDMSMEEMRKPIKAGTQIGIELGTS